MHLGLVKSLGYSLGQIWLETTLDRLASAESSSHKGPIGSEEGIEHQLFDWPGCRGRERCWRYGIVEGEEPEAVVRTNFLLYLAIYHIC